jgi:hypothetical protein
MAKPPLSLKCDSRQHGRCGRFAFNSKRPLTVVAGGGSEEGGCRQRIDCGDHRAESREPLPARARAAVVPARFFFQLEKGSNWLPQVLIGQQLLAIDLRF